MLSFYLWKCRRVASTYKVSEKEHSHLPGAYAAQMTDQPSNKLAKADLTLAMRANTLQFWPGSRKRRKPIALNMLETYWIGLIGLVFFFKCIYLFRVLKQYNCKVIPYSIGRYFLCIYYPIRIIVEPITFRINSVFCILMLDHSKSDWNKS